MLDDAVYYSRRETDEVAAARLCTDIRVRQVHLLLAEKYGELARRALASVPYPGEIQVEPVHRAMTSQSSRSSRRLR
jgi:hypothetical protein